MMLVQWCGLNPMARMGRHEAFMFGEVHFLAELDLMIWIFKKKKKTPPSHCPKLTILTILQILELISFPC